VQAAGAALGFNNHRESIIVNYRTGCRVHTGQSRTTLYHSSVDGGGSGSCGTDGGHIMTFTL